MYSKPVEGAGRLDRNSKTVSKTNNADVNN